MPSQVTGASASVTLRGASAQARPGFRVERARTKRMGIGDDGRDAAGGVARDEIVRELVREPKGSDGRSEKGEVGERGDPRAIDELRRYVCRVLGVDPKVEGESVVPFKIGRAHV